MKKFLVILALVVSTLSVSYAYPADQEIWARSSTYVNFQSKYKTLNATYTGTIHYYLEIKNYGKAFIKIWKKLDSDLLFADHYSGGTSTYTWKNASYQVSNKFISTVQVEVQIDPQKPGLDNFASTRWEW